MTSHRVHLPIRRTSVRVRTSLSTSRRNSRSVWRSDWRASTTRSTRSVAPRWSTYSRIMACRHGLDVRPCWLAFRGGRGEGAPRRARWRAGHLPLQDGLRVGNCESIPRKVDEPWPAPLGAVEVDRARHTRHVPHRRDARAARKNATGWARRQYPRCNDRAARAHTRGPHAQGSCNAIIWCPGVTYHVYLVRALARAPSCALTCPS